MVVTMQEKLTAVVLVWAVVSMAVLASNPALLFG